MPPRRPNLEDLKIERPKQLLVEGNDQCNFFAALARHLKCQDLQIHNFGGVNELPAFLRGFTGATGYASVTSLGIVRDAEEQGEAAAWSSVRAALSNAKMPVPARVGQQSAETPAVSVLILPGGSQPGMLETVLNRTFADDPVNNCIDAFLECVEQVSGQPANRPAKARAHAYLTTQPEPHVSVGVAALKGYWNFDHEAFAPLRSFLTAL